MIFGLIPLVDRHTKHDLTNIRDSRNADANGP